MRRGAGVRNACGRPWTADRDFGPDRRLGAEKRLGDPRIPAGRNPEISLPAAERARIDAQQPSELLPRDARMPAIRFEALTERGARRRRGVEADQGQDAGQEAESRGRPAQFPVGDGTWVHAEPLGHFALEEAQIEPPLAQVISYRCKDLRVEAGQGTRAAQVGMAKRQRGDAGQGRRRA
jgi:hypothetical protein